MEPLERAAEPGNLTFARNFFKNPRMLGSVIPSSRYLVHQLVRKVRWDEARVIVEYGPGVGTLTRAILRRMRPDAALVVIELNDDFVSVLRRGFDDPRLHVVHGSAVDIKETLARLGLPKADCVFSGIPFSTMSELDRERVLKNTRDALREGGSMLVYQFSSRVGAHLERVFDSVESGFELRNFLPARIWHCVRN